MPDNLPKSLIGRVGFGALLLALALAPLIGGYPAGPTYNADVSLNALHCLALIAALCTFVSGERGEEKRDRWPRIIVWTAVGLVVLSFLVQSRFFTSSELLFASLPGMLDWLCYGLLYTLALRFGRGRAALWLVGALAIGAGIAAVSSVQEYGQFVQGGNPAQRAQGVFFSPNFAGGLMALLLPVVIAACIATRQRLMPLVLGAVAAMMAGALFATGSRASVGFAGVGLLVALGFSIPRLKADRSAWVRIGAMVVVLFVLGFAFRAPLQKRVESAGQEQSVDFRSWTWKGTLAMAKAHPILGAGPGTFPYLYPRYALVARTDLAHSSYIQMAAEEGFPALAVTIIVLGMALFSGAARLARWARNPDVDPFAFILTAGLLGGLLAAMARSVVDSEWSILGDAFAFWTVAGLLQGIDVLSAKPVPVAAGTRRITPIEIVLAAGSLAGFVLSLLCLNTAQQRVVMRARARGNERLIVESAGWPPDPQLLYYAQKLDEAAKVEPTGRRFYQLARYKSDAGDLNGAIAALQQSVEVEPTSMQAWRRLAETQEKAGDAAGALRSWKKLTELYEGPVGKIRAIPEATETHPAFAYSALARDAARRGNISEAATFYEKAAGIVESYAKTPPLYQQMELIVAMSSGVSVEERRQELRSLYEQIMTEWSGMQKERAGELATRRDQTLALFDKMATAGAPAASGGT